MLPYLHVLNTHFIASRDQSLQILDREMVLMLANRSLSASPNFVPHLLI